MAVTSTPTNRPGRPGEYQLYRSSSGELVPPDNVKAALNCVGYERVHVQVVVEPGVTANLTVYSWSEAAEAFIPLVPAVTVTSPGAGKSYETTLACDGRCLFILSNAACELYASGVRYSEV